MNKITLLFCTIYFFLPMYAGKIAIESSNKFCLITTIENRLFFIYDDGIHGNELWTSDGTVAGTKMVKDIYPGKNSAFDGGIDFEVLNNILFFTANDNIHGYELWKSDGTEEGTLQVDDIFLGYEPDIYYPYNSSYPYNLTKVNGLIFFGVQNPVTSLWKTDGTSVVMIQEITKGCMGPCLQYFAATDSAVYFESFDSRFYCSDGTINNVKQIAFTKCNHGGYEVINNNLFFVGSDDENGNELWISDGTIAGTHMVKAINKDSISSIMYFVAKTNNNVFFISSDKFNSELWKSNGTEEGTIKIYDNKPFIIGTTDSILFFSKEWGNQMFCYSEKDSIYPLMDMGVAHYGGLSFGIPSLCYNGFLYFINYTGSGIWKSNGTQVSTIKITNDSMVKIYSTSKGYLYSGFGFRRLNNSLVYVNSTYQMSIVDLNTYDTSFIYSSGYPINYEILANDYMYFVTYSTVLQQPELWRTDGTVNGTFRLMSTYEFVLNESDSTFKIFPSPANDYFNLIFLNNNSRKIEIVDIMGRKCRSISTTENEIQIHVEDMTSGIYIIKISDQTNSVSKKIQILK